MLPHPARVRQYDLPRLSLQLQFLLRVFQSTPVTASERIGL